MTIISTLRDFHPRTGPSLLKVSSEEGIDLGIATNVKAAQNKDIPSTINIDPIQSNCLTSVFIFPDAGIRGTVQKASNDMMKKKMATTINAARQLKILVAIPEDILPNIKPIGLPAPKAPVALLRRRPSGYVAKSVPIAGGDIIAVPRPRNPQRTFRAIGLSTKEAIRDIRLRNAMPPRSCAFPPKRSAVFPKNNMNEPLASLWCVSKHLNKSRWSTYPIAAAIHVTCADVIFKLFPMVAVFMTMTPRNFSHVCINWNK